MHQALRAAVDMALKSGVPTKTHVLNLLHRLVDDLRRDLPASEVGVREVRRDGGVLNLNHWPEQVGPSQKVKFAGIGPECA